MNPETPTTPAPTPSAQTPATPASPATPATPASGPEPIPFARFQEVNDRYQASLTELQRLRPLETEVAWRRAGLQDAEALQIAETFYNGLPAEGRPDRDAWLRSGQIPRGLQAYMNPPAAATPVAPAQPAPATPQSAAVPAVPLERPNGTVAATTPAVPSSEPTADELAALRAEATRTGRWEAFNAAVARVSLKR